MSSNFKLFYCSQKMRANSIEPRRLADTILCERRAAGGDNIATKNMIEKELQPYLNRFKEQLNSFKQSAIEKLKHTQNPGSTEKEMDSYIALTIENVRKIALVIFTEFIKGNQPPSPGTDSALMADCERFLAIISNDQMLRFSKDILRYSLNNQARTKLAQLPHEYIPVVAPVLPGQSSPTTDTFIGLRELALNQLQGSISRMKSGFPIAYNVKTIFSNSDEAALRSITTLGSTGDGQNYLDKFAGVINDIASHRIEKHVEKADTEIQSSLPT